MGGLLWATTAAAGPLVGRPGAARAKDLPVVTLEEGFRLLRAELEPGGGVYTLGGMVEAEDWDSILKYTKEYDLTFRKLTMKEVTNALAAAGMPDKEKAGKELRDKFNYDLIALNKASRPQFRAIARPSADADMVELKSDLNKFLALDPNPPPPPPSPPPAPAADSTEEERGGQGAPAPAVAPTPAAE